MSSVPIPQSPQYRITLFYGPETRGENPARLSCVFNVKKRSWKSGVQVDVEVTADQVRKSKDLTEFESWLREVLLPMSPEERDDYEARARDLFIQGLCSLKLDLAVKSGLPQKNGSIAADRLVHELESAIPHQADRLKSHILAELDLPV